MGKNRFQRTKKEKNKGSKKKTQKNGTIELGEGRYGRRVLTEPHFVPIDSIIEVPEYQRTLKEAIIKKIMRSLTDWGFRDDGLIEVNELMQIIDGQQRLEAARRLGLSEVKIQILQFPSKAIEAKYFVSKCNEFASTPLDAPDEWNGFHESNDIIANVLYMIGRDDNASVLKGKVALRGCATVKTKITIGATLEVANKIGVGIPKHWERRHHTKFSMLYEQAGYVKIRDGVNNFFNWLFTTFGEKKDNPMVYRAKVFRSLIIIFQLLRDSGHLSTVRKYNSVVRKFQTFVFTQPLLQMDQAAVTLALASHFNKGRKTNRLHYAI